MPDASLLDQALEREGIRKLVTHYNHMGDRARGDAYAATFTEDGVLDADELILNGRAAIADYVGNGKAFREGMRRPSVIHHHISTHQIDLAGPTTATGTVYFVVFSDIGPDHWGFYYDEYRKVGSEWLIANRKVRPAWMDEQSFGRIAEG